MRPLRVTLVEFAPAGGLFQFGYQLGAAIAERGHDVELLTGPRPEFSSYGSFRVIPTLRTWHPHEGAELPRTLRRIRRVGRAGQLAVAWAQVVGHLRRRQPDLVLWAEWRFALDAWGALLARAAVPKAVMMDLAHTPRPFSEQRTSGSFYRGGRTLTGSLAAAYSRMDAVLVLGEGARRQMIEDFPGLRGVHVIDHGDERILSEVAVSAPSTAPPQALFFGTLARYKGIPALLDAWRVVRHRLPQARLVIAGATVDVDVDQIRRVAEEVGGVDLRLGYVAADDVPALFAAARLLVAPYRIANTSGVIRVAHGFGRPVVVTDVGDLAAAVDHGRTGLVVAPDDAPALAAAMLRLLVDSGECDRLGDAGKAGLEHAAAWTTVADQVLEVFRETERRLGRRALPDTGRQ